MNIVVIICDTLRRDFLGCYGNEWVQTPSIDALAGESLVFDRAYSGSFPTMPHRAEVMAGDCVFHTVGWAPLQPGAVRIQQVLRQQGYITMLVTDHVQMLASGMNYHVGFHGHAADPWRTDHGPVQFPCAPEKLRQPELLMVPHLRNNRGRLHEREWHDPLTVQHAMDWLERNYRHEKWLLYLDLFGIHEPWDPPGHYVDLYDPGYVGEEVVLPRYDFSGYLTSAEIRHVRALYAGMITMTDRWLGMLFQKLRELGAWDNTAIVFTADHGWYHGEHGRLGKHTVLEPKKGWPLYEEINHVPLLMKVPGVTPGRTPALAQSVDVMPTVVALGDGQAPAGIHGRTLMPVLQSPSATVRDLAVSSPMLTTDPSVQIYSTVTDGEWTLIDGGGAAASELYHLPSDPAQASNVLSERSGIAGSLHERYLAFLEEIGTAPEKLDLRRW